MDPQKLIYKKIGCTSCNIEKANSLRRDTKEIFVDGGKLSSPFYYFYLDAQGTNL